MKVQFDYSITEREQKAALKVLSGGRIYAHEEEECLGKEWRQHFGRRYAIVTSSGTAAIHCSLLASGIGPEDEVIAPPNTCWCVLYPILYIGAKPTFVDVEYDTMNVNPSQIESKITSRTKAMILVSTAGHPVDFDPILELAKSHNLRVINDMAQAAGAKYKGRSCDALGDLSVSSFGRHKHISSAGGVGIVSTDNEELAEAVQRWSHQGQGLSFRPDPTGTKLGTLDLGYRYGPSEIHCAIARVQFKRFVTGEIGPEKRRRNAAQYNSLLHDLVPDVNTPTEKPWAYHTYLRYIVKTAKRNKLFKHLTKKNIRVFIPPGTIPLHMYRIVIERNGDQTGMFPVSERLFGETLTLPSWATLTQRQLRYVVKCIRQFYKQN